MEAAHRTLAIVGWQARGFRRMWRGSITVSFLNPIFFLVSIGVLLGNLVDQSDPDLGGLTYLEFVAPALLATTAMQTAASVTTFTVRAGLKWWRTYHAVVATPVRVGELVGGILAWAGVRVSSPYRSSRSSPRSAAHSFPRSPPWRRSPPSFAASPSERCSSP